VRKRSPSFQVLSRMMKELKFENRYNKKGFLAKRKRNRKMELTWFFNSWGFRN
jgi:hypothetical protein